MLAGLHTLLILTEIRSSISYCSNIVMEGTFGRFKARFRPSRLTAKSSGPISLILTFLSSRISICSWKSLIPSATTSLLMCAWIYSLCFTSFKIINCFVNYVYLSLKLFNWLLPPLITLSGTTLFVSEGPSLQCLLSTFHLRWSGSKFTLIFSSPNCN